MKSFLNTLYKIVSVILIASGVINVIFDIMPIFDHSSIDKKLITQLGSDLNIYLIVGAVYGALMLVAGVLAFRNIAKKELAIVLLLVVIAVGLLCYQNLVLTNLWSDPSKVFSGLLLLCIFFLLTIYNIMIKE